MKKVTLEEIKQLVREKKEFKIQVTPETSKLVQEAIIEAGGEWNVSQTPASVRYVEKPCLTYSKGVTTSTENKLNIYWTDLVDFTRFTEKVQEIELLIPEFRTQSEIWGHLLSGGSLVSTYHNGSYFKMVNGFVRKFNSNTDVMEEGLLALCFTNVKEYSKRKEWYEEIPEKGILCWVWDTPGIKYVDIVVSGPTLDTLDFVTHRGSEWRFAEPLTQQEFEEYMFKGKING